MCHECFHSLLYKQKLFTRNIELILIRFLIYRIYLGGLRFTGNLQKALCSAAGMSPGG